MMWSEWHDGWGWLATSMWMVALWVLVVAATVALTRGGKEAASRPVEWVPADPRALLDERFARGEIDAAEYQERRALLRSTS